MNTLELVPNDQPHTWSQNMHPGVELVASGTAHGNTDARFDSHEIATENRLRLLGQTGCTKLAYMLPNGGDSFEDVDDHEINDLELGITGDGLVTTKLSRGLMLNAADCAPLTLFDPETKVLALAHIGRQGAVLDLASIMITYMQRQFGVKSQRLLAHFGPAIAPAAYVLPELRGALLDKSWKPHLRETAAGFETDFVGYTIEQLKKLSVAEGNITKTNTDTSSGDTFFSLTRHKQAGAPNGRNGYIAAMRSEYGVK